jgi:predicted esterase
MRELHIATTTHGRVLVEDGKASNSVRLLIGFHGYAQNADEIVPELRAIAGPEAWTVASVQALHRFYRGRSETTVASWMTRQDREIAIADNITYVDAVVIELAAGRTIDRLVFCGFSQGVAMAFRAAVRGRRPADAVLALGGDVPPELMDDRSVSFPRVVLARGTRDDFYRAETFERDKHALGLRGVRLNLVLFDGGHEWHDAFTQAGAALLRELDATR